MMMNDDEEVKEEIEQFQLFPEYEAKIRHTNGLIRKKRPDPNPGGKKQNWIPSREFLKELIEDGCGDFKSVADSLAYPDGSPVNYQTVYKWLKKYDLDIYQELVRVKIADSALKVTHRKAVRDEDLKACEMILKRWGKYIGFEEPKEKIEYKGELEIFAEQIRNSSQVSRAEEFDEPIMENS